MSETIEVELQVLPEGRGLPLPTYMSSHAAGCDLYAAIERDVTIAPGERRLVSTGIALAVPPGYEAQVRPRSGLALKHGITCLNSPGTIDSDYRGPVSIILVNHGSDPFVVRRGDRIAQLIVARVAQANFRAVDRLDATLRGNAGFGSTGHTTESN
jgi:dUTP pyrophosphatase